MGRPHASGALSGRAALGASDPPPGEGDQGQSRLSAALDETARARARLTVVTPTPRLKGALRVLDPRKIPREDYAEAATLTRGGKWGEDVALAKLPKIDLVVMGSVAVTRGGRRLGKGHGYADLEYGMLRELGNPAVPVVTTVPPLQVLEDFATESHDLPVRLIATPDAPSR